MELVDVAGLAASKFQGSFSVCFPSVESHVCTVGCHTWPFTWMPGIQHKSLCSKDKHIPEPSPRPSPHSALFGRRSPASGCITTVSSLLCTSSRNACLLLTPLLESLHRPTLAFTGEPCLTPLVFLMLTRHQNTHPLSVFICKRK